MPGYLIDTNVLIAWFGGGTGADQLAELLKSPGNEFYTSIVCVAEFFAGCSADDSEKLIKILEDGMIKMLPFSGIAQAETVARLRKSLGLKTPDAIVAAAAAERKLLLFTLDREFANKARSAVDVFDMPES